MAKTDASENLLRVLRETTVRLVRRDGADLSARQLGVFLICYTETELQTVRGLAAMLRVSKPAITRALDRLAEFDLVRRQSDPLDRRSVLIQRTVPGQALFRDVKSYLKESSEMAAAPVAAPAKSAPRRAVAMRAAV